MPVSPSQVATWRSCKRKWAYSRTRSRKSNESAEFGTRTHTVLERWLVDGEAPDPTTPEGACAIPGLVYLPPPRSDVAVEVPIDLEHDGVQYVGFADLVYRPEQWLGVVHDHKTTGDLRWAKSPAELEDDPQRIVYGHWAATVLGVPWILAVWGYLRRKPPGASPVTVLESAEQLAARFADLHERDGRPIAAAGPHPNPEDFPRSLDHCGAFGGCPYHTECHTDLDPAMVAVAALRR